VHSRKAILAFCRLAHRIVWCTTGHCPVRISFLLWRSRPLALWMSLAHRTLSGAHRTVRCPLPTVGSATCLTWIARPTVGPADRWPTGQSGELYPYAINHFSRAASSPESAWRTEHCPVHHRTLSGAPRQS
jgi:hypothetical protein